MSEEFCKNQSIKRMGIPNVMKGKKLPQEWKDKIKLNSSTYWKGKKRPNISKFISERNKGNKYNWKGGISLEPYSTDWTNTLKRSIRERDHYICQLCYLPQDDEALSIHHIDYNKKNCNPDNLISLHRKCHLKTNQHREYWINYFKINDR